MKTYELIHSAKGTSWNKKDHKYVKKEGSRYYYKIKEEPTNVSSLDLQLPDEVPGTDIANGIIDVSSGIGQAIRQAIYDNADEDHPVANGLARFLDFMDTPIVELFKQKKNKEDK